MHREARNRDSQRERPNMVIKGHAHCQEHQQNFTDIALFFHRILRLVELQAKMFDVEGERGDDERVDGNDKTRSRWRFRDGTRHEEIVEGRRGKGVYRSEVRLL